jgi:hypothetical protein
MNPIAAGPTRMPAYPSVVIAGTGTFSGITFWRPAAENITGTIFGTTNSDQRIAEKRHLPGSP